MAKSENNIFNEIRIAVSSAGARLFRNNVGAGWIGRSVKVTPSNINSIRSRIKTGDVVISDARRFNSGLCKGSSDGIGWTPVLITQDMVGNQLAVFTAIEAKTARGRASPEQKNFIDQVNNAGGIAGVARSGEDAERIVNELPH